MDVLTAPENQPFAIAALIMAGLVAIEVATFLFGLSFSHVVEKGFDFDSHHPGHELGHDGGHGPIGAGGLLGWVNAGRVPVVVLLMIFLGGFAAAGFIVQTVAAGIWRPLPGLLAIASAVVAAVPLTRLASRAVSRIIPRDETYAVDVADFVGRTAQITIGPLDEGLPGRVRLRDAYGNWQFVRARAAKGHGPIPVGETVLLVDREGTAFLAVPAPDELKADR